MTWPYGSSSFNFLSICHMFPIVVAAFYNPSKGAQGFEFFPILKNSYFVFFFLIEKKSEKKWRTHHKTYIVKKLDFFSVGITCKQE